MRTCCYVYTLKIASEDFSITAFQTTDKLEKEPVLTRVRINSFIEQKGKLPEKFSGLSSICGGDPYWEWREKITSIKKRGGKC